MTSGVLLNASWRVTDRSGGDSQGAFATNNLAMHVGDDPARVAANRARLAAQMGAQALVFTSAVHSNKVAYVAGACEDVPGVDALITDRPGVAVAAQGADCVVLGLAAGDFVAAVHCGWKGLVTGIVPATLQALTERGADLRTASAHVGPSICGACYTVPAQRARQVAAVRPESVVGGPGPAIDVRAGVLAELALAGIAADVDPRCTAEDSNLFSYRRDGRTGRQALIIMREAA